MSSFKLEPYRVGYESQNPTKSKISLKALNEAITVMIQVEIFNHKHLQDINKKFGFDMKTGIKMESDISIKILHTIMLGVSKYNKENVTDTRKRFESGMFTGNMLHLRDIEKAFGQGSLKILNNWQQETEINKEPTTTINTDVLQYFQTQLESINT